MTAKGRQTARNPFAGDDTPTPSPAETPNTPTPSPAETPSESGTDTPVSSNSAVTLGRWVHYRLSEADVREIEHRRVLARRHNKHSSRWPLGNDVVEGQEYAALVVAVHDGGTVNLRAVLDGEDDWWVTSRSEGDDNGCWHWPERV